MNQDMQQLLNAILPELVAIRAEIGSAKSELKTEIGQLSRLTAVEFSKVHGELATLKRTTATRQELSRLRLEMNGRFDGFTQEVAEVHALRAGEGQASKQQQGQLNDHERRLSRLEERRP